MLLEQPQKSRQHAGASHDWCRTSSAYLKPVGRFWRKAARVSNAPAPHDGGIWSSSGPSLRSRCVIASRKAMVSGPQSVSAF